MNFRINGLNTPLGGITWEYKDKEEEKDAITPSIFPSQKVKVFISSICGVEKYDNVRAELKGMLERTQFFDVYTFESKGASSISACNHYKWALEDADVCIFLIDNEDGITSGVQKEIDTVQKYNIKALYYFCDETKKEKTILEQSLMGAKYSKSKTVHAFAELSKDGARSLINEVIMIYHFYCRDKISVKTDENDELQTIRPEDIEKYQTPKIPKTALSNVDKSRDYILWFVFGFPRTRYYKEKEKTSSFDEWGVEFLPVLFEGRSIKQFNTSMFLEVLKASQEVIYYQIVEIRWKAIQFYFMGDLSNCIENLEIALNKAKETNQPIWIINDILIDLRNQHWTYCTEKNEYAESNAQKELWDSKERAYYPILECIDKAIYEKSIEGLYKNKIASPNSVTFGNNFDGYGEMFASSLIVSMYNGSLTHILIIYEKMKNFLFYLNCKYDDWNIRINLYKLAVFKGDKKEINGIEDSYPEILNNMNANEATAIMNFCLNHSIKYRRFNSELLAFGSVGDFLNESDYKCYEKNIINEIKSWINDDNGIVSIGYSIFQCLSGISYRISQDTLADICCKLIDKHYVRWYNDMFKLICNHIDLRRMSNDSAKRLINHINFVFENEKGREEISKYPHFLYILRKQNNSLTQEMDKNVAEYLPQYYIDHYKLETTEDKMHDMPIFIRKKIENIKENNEKQGKNGCYFVSGTREIETVRLILLDSQFKYDLGIMDNLISTVAKTLLASKENILTKLDAVALLTCIVIKYPDDYLRNQNIYEEIFQHSDVIQSIDNDVLASNIDAISLKIGLQLLYASMGKDVYNEMLELMPYIQGDVATTLEVALMIIKYLETSNDIVLPSRIESIILQNVLQWLHSDNKNLRWNATRILIKLSRNSENYGIINRQLVNLIDSNNVYIKNLILNNLYKIYGITDETKEYIISKCKNDSNFAVRRCCAEVVNDKLN